MKIYFAGAIRGGREDAQLYKDIIKYLFNKGQVLTEHIGDTNLSCRGEKSTTDESIFNRDINWLQLADVVVAEVTTPSLGVGYELGVSEKLKKPVLCLYRPSENNHLSAMVKGNKQFSCLEYHNLSDAKICIDTYFQGLINDT